VVLSVCLTAIASAALPNPVLKTVFPAGGRAGSTVELAVTGSRLDGLTTLVFSHLEIVVKLNEKGRFEVTIPAAVPTGQYDVRALGRNGLSSPRTFVVGTIAEFVETEPNNTSSDAQDVAVNSTINGRIGKGGDEDRFRFSAKKGQRVVIECTAERLDARLRAVIEVYDAKEKRLAVNRGFFGIDPLIVFDAPADGSYVVRVFDLVYSGSADHVYRLDVDTGPRIAFAVPPMVQAGRTSRVTLYGWNLLRQNLATIESGEGASGPELPSTVSPSRSAYDRIDVDIAPPKERSSFQVPLRLRSSEVAVNAFAYRYQGSSAPIAVGVTDVPVVATRSGHHSASTALEIAVPCEISGQLVAGDELDYYAVDAKRGEVLWIEAFGERIGSPVDLDVSILDGTGKRELARFSDEKQNIGGKLFPTSHLDPSGRWVAPADGQYLILIRNLIGSLDDDPRCVYHLSVRREVPDFDLAVLSRLGEPASLNIERGGRTVVDVLAFRRRGLTGSIRVTAKDLPPGIECPDVWLGPGVNRVPLTITASENVKPFVGRLQLVGQAESADSREVHGGTSIDAGAPVATGRLTMGIPFAVGGAEAPIRIIADGHETRKHDLYGELKVRHSPGSILDVAVQVDRKDPAHSANVIITGIGLPPSIRNQTATIPAGKKKGYVSFYLPSTLPTGTYTVGIQATTTVPVSTGGKPGTPKSVTVFSNSVTFKVHPAAFILEIDRNAPKTIRRGQYLQVKFTGRRINGFINKMHTEMTAPGGVIGLRARGSSFVGQTDSGALQIIANEDAPLGKQPFVRFYAVGVVEDHPVYHGSYFLDLEIVE
jgi:hypothetical protein